MHERHVVELLAQGLDGPLTPDERTRVDEHLQICPACRAEGLTLRELDNLLHNLVAQPTAQAEPDFGFTTRTMARIAAYEQARNRQQWLVTLVILFAGALTGATWLWLNLGTLLATAGLYFNTLASITPVAVKALFVLVNHAGQGPLLLYALTVFALALMWARVIGGPVRVQQQSSYARF